jgi:pyridoxine 5-phosphate synthase
VATLRQARGTLYPDPVDAARVAVQAGADSITVHLREDRRHIQERDLDVIARTVQTRVNLEMAVAEPVLRIAERLKPGDCCLVPERRAELTTEGGLDVAGDLARIRAAHERLAAVGIRVAPFIDPDAVQIDACAGIGVTAIELHTGRYAEAADDPTRARELERLRRAARHAAGLGLEVHAGHGLNYANVQPVAAIAEVVELNIGHAIVAQALFDGFGKAVADMKRLMLAARA